jgi:Golgi nucleoside diphosphatase
MVINKWKLNLSADFYRYIKKYAHITYAKRIAHQLVCWEISAHLYYQNVSILAIFVWVLRQVSIWSWVFSLQEYCKELTRGFLDYLQKSDLLLRLSTTALFLKCQGKFIWSRKYEELVRALKTFGSLRASLEWPLITNACLYTRKFQG